MERNTWQPAEGRGQVAEAGRKGGLGPRRPGRSRKQRRRCGRWSRGSASGGDEPAGTRPRTRAGLPSAAHSEGEAEGLLEKCGVQGRQLIRETQCARAPELKGARGGPSWAPSYLRLGCCSSPGSQQVSRGEMGPTLAPKEIGSHCCLALLNWPQAGQWRPGLRSDCARRCGHWIEFLPVGICCFSFIN